MIGKNLYNSSIREESKKKLLQSLDIADALDIRIISVNFAADPSKIFGVPKTDTLGKPKSFLSSRDASEDDFKMITESMQIAAQKAKIPAETVHSSGVSEKIMKMRYLFQM